MPRFALAVSAVDVASLPVTATETGLELDPWVLAVPTKVAMIASVPSGSERVEIAATPVLLLISTLDSSVPLTKKFTDPAVTLTKLLLITVAASVNSVPVAPVAGFGQRRPALRLLAWRDRQLRDLPLLCRNLDASSKAEHRCERDKFGDCTFECAK
jgi:hypothetical protein